MIFIRESVFHTYWTPVLYTVLIILYLHNYEAVNDCINANIYNFGSYPSAQSITIFTVFTIVAPIPIIAIKILYNAIRLRLQQRSIEKIDRNFSQFSEVMTSVKTINDISPKLRDRIKNKAADKFAASGKVTQEDLYAFIEEEIMEEYHSLSYRLSRL